MKTYPGRSTYTHCFKKRRFQYRCRLKRVRPFISMHTAIEIYKGLIEPHFDYCSVVWNGLSQQLSEKLQKQQNCVTRVITKSSYNTNSGYFLNSLSWDNLSVRRMKQKANLMYKCVNKLAPNYLCNMSTPRTLSSDLRDASQKLYLPKPRTDYLKRSFSYSGASLWNDLPEDTGLQITNGQAPVTLSGQTCFCSDTTRFWPVKF